MIELTIKTLDSRNHAFTVGDELTVKQLKDHIAESVNVPAESQRLIYCGRVLVDDKKLSEYDVNGKVIHLVQRAPPSSSSEAGNSGAEPRPSSRRPFRATIFNQGGIRVDGAAGNAMYLGAMAFPADLMDAQGISLPNPRHVSQSRLAVVRSFIRRARFTLQNLENPAHNESPTEINPQPPPNNQTAPAPMDFAFVAQALSDAVSRAAGSLSNSSVPPPIINVEVVASNDNNPPTDSATESAQPTEEPVETASEASAARSDSPDASTTPPNAPEEQAPNGREGEDPVQRTRSRFSRPAALADLVSQAMNIHTRLAPFLDRYYELLREDPALENHQEAQRLFNSVSELLHHMAHAYHAISDVMCDFSQSPPRLLQCRPVLIHHSAVLQTGIPIQLNLGGGSQSRGTATGGADSERNAEGPQADSNGNSASVAPQREEPMRERARAESEPSASEAERRERTDRTPTPPREQRERGPRAFNLTPGGGLEFIMDVGQGSIHIDSVEATVIPAGGAASSGNSETSGSSAPPELLNLWQALGHVTNLANRAANSASASNAATSAPSDATSSPPSNSGSGSATTSRLLAGGLPGVQAWTNTETQPTTSTQTRATTRPHVHISPGLQGVGMPGFFDPFLPCSSHHIRNHWRRNQAQSEQSESSQTQTGAQRARSNSENNASGGPNAASSGSSQGHRIGPIRLTPDVTVVLQAPSRVSMEFPSGSPSLIDMIEASPPQFPEGTSLYADMFLALARHLTVSDVRDLNFRHILTRARPHLTTFFRTRLTSGREDMEGINEGITRFNQDIRPLLDAALDSLDDIPMREDVDIIASINLVNTYFLPRMVSTVMNGDSDLTCFMNFNKSWMEYVNTLASIFHYCCLNGESDAENAFMRLGVRFLNAIPGLEIWAGYRVHRTVRQLLSELSPSNESARNFLVYRMAASGPAPPGGLNPEPSVATAAVTPPPAMDIAPPQPSTPQPMEVEDSVVVAEQLTEELPDVILDVHPDWVPIITRDRERQRRQAAQGPLSDAYLSGMPSKRRKIVSSSKPQGSLARVISESMSTAISAAGVPLVESVVESAASDSTVRKAYKEQLRLTVGATVKSHPDFKPDKYPNSSKVFSSK